MRAHVFFITKKRVNNSKKTWTVLKMENWKIEHFGKMEQWKIKQMKNGKLKM